MFIKITCLYKYTKKMYYKEIINSIIDVLSRFKGMNYVDYVADDLVNQQHNNKTLQAYIDNISLSQYNLTTNVNKIELQVYILGFPDKTPESVLDIQDQCYNAAVNLLAYIDNMPQFQGKISLYDWSILTLDRFTAQNNAGVKVSVVLNAMSPINLCTLGDWFGEPYTPEEDKEIDIQPITLPVSNCCK